jgi:hypothetical protein
VKSQTPAAVRRCQMDGAPLNSPSPSLQNVTSIKRVASNPNLTPQKHE